MESGKAQDKSATTHPSSPQLRTTNKNGIFISPDNKAVSMLHASCDCNVGRPDKEVDQLTIYWATARDCATKILSCIAAETCMLCSTSKRGSAEEFRGL